MKRPGKSALRPPDYLDEPADESPDGKDGRRSGLYSRSSSDFGSTPRGAGEPAQGGSGARRRGQGGNPARRERLLAAGGGFGADYEEHDD